METVKETEELLTCSGQVIDTYQYKKKKRKPKIKINNRKSENNNCMMIMNPTFILSYFYPVLSFILVRVELDA